jgi:hypothetical protein
MGSVTHSGSASFPVFRFSGFPVFRFFGFSAFLVLLGRFGMKRHPAANKTRNSPRGHTDFSHWAIMPQIAYEKKQKLKHTTLAVFESLS